MDIKKIILFLCLLVNFSFADVVILDYPITDEIIQPVSIGIITWSDNNDNTFGGYGSICCLSYNNKLRFELGMAFTTNNKLDIAPLTGISTPIGDTFVVGAWCAPFWNLFSDDPYGLLLGYRF